MPRIAPIEMHAAGAKARELLEELAGRGGEPGPIGAFNLVAGIEPADSEESPNTRSAA